MEVTLNSAHLAESVMYAKSRQRSDRRWGTTYWFLHNTCVGLSLIAQLFVVFGLALMLYIADAQRNFTNIVLVFVSFLGLVSALLDAVLGFNRRSRILTRTADTIELALARFGDGKMSDDEFITRLIEIVSMRQEQHND
jgi:hypothetical protein